MFRISLCCLHWEFWCRKHSLIYILLPGRSYLTINFPNPGKILFPIPRLTNYPWNTSSYTISMDNDSLQNLFRDGNMQAKVRIILYKYFISEVFESPLGHFNQVVIYSKSVHVHQGRVCFPSQPIIAFNDPVC